MSKTISPYFSLEKLSEGIYAAIAKKGEGAMSNSGFIDLGNEVVIFDTFTTPNAARDLRRLAEELTNKEVKYVLNSHYHGDHTFGNQIFEDTTIISTPMTRDLHRKKNVLLDPVQEMEDMKEYLKQLEQRMKSETDPVLLSSLENQYNEIAKVREAVPELRIVLPNLTFEDKLIIHGSARKLEIYCFGGGHTASDAFLYLPDEKIAFMGDLVLENHHPPIYNSQEFMKNLMKVYEIDIQTIVPGHGRVVSKDQIEVMLKYLNHLNEIVSPSIEKGEPLDQVLLSDIPEEYSTWTGIDGYKRSLSAVYNEQKA